MSEAPPAARPSTGPAPWILAGVLAVVVAGLVLLLLHVDSARVSAGSGADLGPTAEQEAAVRAGAIEAANMLTFRRAHFDADYARALHGMTGALERDFSSAKTRRNTLQTMQKNKIDLRASVVQSAFESQSGNAVLVLVTVDGEQVNSKGQTSVPNPQRLELTMVDHNGRWLASNLVSVGIE